MEKQQCRYCSKKYVKAKHFQNHLEKKHGKLIDLISVPRSEVEIIEQEAASISIPKNPLEMTPDVLMKLSPDQTMRWLWDLVIYQKYQIILNGFFASVGIYQTTPGHALSLEIEEKLKKLEVYEREESLRKAFQPVLDEMRELRQTIMGKRILDENKKIESSLNLILFNDLSRPAAHND